MEYLEKTNKYDYTSLTQATATTDVDIKDTEATAFSNWTSYTLVEITTDVTLIGLSFS